MALSFAEKRDLQKEVRNCLEALNEQQDFRTKRSLQKTLSDTLARLGEGLSEKVKSLLDRFLSGEFTKSTGEEMWKTFCKVFQEAKGELDILKDSLEKFFSWHDKDGAIYESAYTGEANGLFSGMPPHKNLCAAVRAMPGGLEFGAPQTITIDIDTEFDSPETFREIIRAIEQARVSDTLILKVNSHGGRTDSAQALYVALLEAKAKTIAKIITAYSSGSIVAMACDEIRTTPHCTMMIHNASSGSWGKIGELKAQSSFLETHFRKWFEELYAGFLTTEEIADVFKGQDVWLREEDIRERLPKWKPIRERRSPE